ncbi:MAG: GNAT family N-acetyltransferase [Phycisphaeraceae bacterium]|nr:GNAT family N-acetyltransferase [Phycisphaeraceae bacterium]
MPSEFTTTPASKLPLTELAGRFNAVFADYHVEITLDEATFSGMIAGDGVDLSRSLVALDTSRNPVGLCLLAARGRRLRIDAMATLPANRGKGIGSLLLSECLRDPRGAATAQLEVIAANEGARRLYERHGFSVARTLIGVEGAYNGEVFDTPEAAELTEVDPWTALSGRRIVTKSPPAWQLEPHRPFGEPNIRAYELGPALCVVSLGGEHNHIRVITTDPDHTGCGWASALLSRVMAAHPGKAWRIIAILPEEWGTGLYERVGMRRVDWIEQREMFKAL